MKTFIKKERILERIKEAYNIRKDADLAIFLGISRSTLSNWGTRNSIDYDLVFSKCESLNFDWLLTGQGTMFRTDDIPTLSPSSPTSLENVEAITYCRMYQEEREENKKLLKEIGHLEERIRILQENQENQQIITGLDKEKGKEGTVKNASSSKFSSSSTPNANSANAL